MSYVIPQLIMAVQMTYEAINLNSEARSSGSSSTETGSSAEVLADDPTSDLRVLETPTQIKAYITKQAEHYNLDVDLALAIAEVESNFRNVCNTGGCQFGQGIYQFVFSTWEEQCEGEIDNPQDNINCALKLISKGEIWRWEKSKGKWGVSYLERRVLIKP